MREILQYLDSITLSIDSTDSDINKKLGRGKSHWDNIKSLLEYFRNVNVKVNINTVVSKINIGEVETLGEVLQGFDINAWRIFKFMPLRERAEENREQFEISDTEFEAVTNKLLKRFKRMKIETRQEGDMENKYTLLVANRRYNKDRKWNRCKKRKRSISKCNGCNERNNRY